MAGKGDECADCRICGHNDNSINRYYTYRDNKNNIIWYNLCKVCEEKGVRL